MRLSYIHTHSTFQAIKMWKLKMSRPLKIMIFGRPGSGKSTFALKLHKLTGIPLYHLDKYFFEANWVERDYQEFLKIQQSLVESSKWIIDGNNIRSLEMRYACADLVLYFNHPRWICYLRVLKRLFNKNPEIEDRAEGCKEVISFKLFRYMWSFESRVAEQITTFKNQSPAIPFIEIRSSKDAWHLENKLFDNKISCKE